MMLKFFKRLFCCSLFFICNNGIAQTAKSGLAVTENAGINSFPLISDGATAAFYFDDHDAKVVQISAAAFVKDIQLITGKQPGLTSAKIITDQFAIVAGTIGQSKLIDELIEKKLLNVDLIKNKWEQFSIAVIPNRFNKKANTSNNSPSGDGGRLLVIAGSDRRGTAFGIFHLSRLLGVSPFVWWADVAPKKRKQLFLSGNYISPAPSVQYRGIFINDEDWGLQPWAAKNMDTDLKDIGPKTYAKVFELLLRLKANYIWPAMHPCTKAFYYYKENPKVADDYAIVVGGSHCEPMLRNNVCEWAETYEEEYKKKPGEWRYDINKAEIYKYWDDRIKEAVHYESVFTVGMRGVHDGSMPGPKDPNEKVKLLEQVIIDQRTILQDNFKKSSTTIPQIFVPYKEVLSLYRRGLQLPDDVTIIWPDDNHGYIRQLPKAAERKRSGGHGVYYHLSYWGAPQDYLWLSSIAPPLIAFEMERAYQQDARRLWVFNAGDIKPAETELQFAMDMAWDIKKWSSANAAGYTQFWAAEIFGTRLSSEIAAIKNEYYLLAASGKPEHLNTVDFTYKQLQKRLKRYASLDQRAQQVKKKIPAELQDAYFQLVLYPVMGALLMNEKFAYAKMGFAKESRGKFTNQSRNAFDSIQQITAIYNAGKWNGMMSWHPRNLPVFKMPVLYNDLTVAKQDSLSDVYYKSADADLVLNVADAKNLKESSSLGFRKISGLGINGKALVTIEKNIQQPDTTAAYIEWEVAFPAGKYEVLVKCLPVFDINTSKQLRYQLSVNGEAGPPVNLHAEADSKAWKENVIRGYSLGKTMHQFKAQKNIIRLYTKDAGLVINTIEFYKK